MQYLPISENIFEDLLSICPTGSECSDSSAFADIFSGELAREKSLFQEQSARAAGIDAAGDPMAAMRERVEQRRERITDTHNTDNNALPAQMDDVELSEEDFAALEQGLEDMGLSKDDIAELRDKVESAEGLTLGGLIKEVSEKLKGEVSKGVELSQSERRDLQSLFQKLGFTPQKSEELIAKLEAGDRKSVIKEISAIVSGMVKGETVGVGGSEMNSLVKAMGLPEDAAKEFKAIFAGGEDKTLGKEDLKMLSAFLKKSAAESDLQDKQNSLRQQKQVVMTLKQAFEKAMPQTEEDKGQGGRILQLLSEAESKLENAAQSPFAKGKPAEAEGAAAEFLAGVKGKEGKEHTDAGKDAAEGVKAAKAESKEAGRSNADGKGGQHFTEQQRNSHDGRLGVDAKADTAAGENADTDDGWNEFWGKVRRDDAGNIRNMEGLNLKAEHAGATTATTAESRAEAAMKAGERVLSKSVLNQVQTGILQKTANGAHKLSLHLRPEHLGTLHLSLTVKNKDVTAVIRAENDEAAGMINEQLATLKQQLEEQGLKVSKLEVRTQLSEERADMHQAGTDLHNEAQERQRFARLRGQMRAMREEAADMVREMQSTEHTARSSHEGSLNLIA